MKYNFDEMFKGIKACLFDLDGTIVDSMWVWEKIDEEYLGKLGYSIPDDLHEAIEGKSFSETAVYFKERFRIEDNLDVICKCWNDMAYDKYVNDIGLKPGALSFLTELKKRGIKTAICTSNSRQLASACLKAREVLGLFDHIVTACEVGAGKPAPDIYLCAANTLCVKPEECLVFEDVLMGIKAGLNAGMKVIAVNDSFSQQFIEEKKKLAQYFIDDYEDIIL